MKDQAVNGTADLLSIEQVAQHLGVTVRHVRRLVFERRIPYVKWGHLLRFEPTAITRFIEAHTHEPAATDGRVSRLHS
jgi:excisionase family DNA binding protein